MKYKNDFTRPSLLEDIKSNRNQIKYVCLILDKRLTWNPHSKSIRKQLKSILQFLRPIFISNFSLNNKIFI